MKNYQEAHLTQINLQNRNWEHEKLLRVVMHQPYCLLESPGKLKNSGVQATPMPIK
jgi:hypothetical protein